MRKPHIPESSVDSESLIIGGSNFFSNQSLDLGIQADKTSKAIISGNSWINFTCKILSKLRLQVLATKIVRRSIKHAINIKLVRRIAICPNDFLMYRRYYWEVLGPKNFHKLYKYFTHWRSSAKKVNQNFFHDLTTYLLVQAVQKKTWLSLIEASDNLEILTNKKNTFLFFDSYHFFNGGHIANIEQTIDNFYSVPSNISQITFIFLLDRKMLLFPELTKLIIKKCKHRLIFDASKLPIKLPETINISDSHGMSITSQSDLKLDKSFVVKDSVFNPLLTWRDYPYKLGEGLQKAWCKTFSREESRKKVNASIYFGETTERSRPYIVIHTRNSTLMSDNIRNSIPLANRAELICGIFNMGLEIIVLGVMNQESKYHDKRITYVDELGPIPDSLQIHILNSATAVIGSPSGITHLTYCTDTPTLLLDMPFPFCSCYPSTGMKALLKKLNYKGEPISIAQYYKWRQKDLLLSGSIGVSSMADQKNIKMVCNSDEAVLLGLQELLTSSITQESLQSLKLRSTKADLNIELAEVTKKDIRKALLTYSKLQDKYPPFQVEDLSIGNWL